MQNAYIICLLVYKIYTKVLGTENEGDNTL